jgi:ATP-dependent helicase/nuclease subunit B
MDHAALIAELDAGATVVTANQRLAHALRHQHALMKIAAGFKAWPTPTVLPYSAFLGVLYEDAILKCADVPLLLNDGPRRALWAEVLRDTKPAPILLQPDATARAAADAFTLARRWRLDLTGLDADEHEDVRGFVRWAAAYQARLKKSDYLDPADLADWLVPRLGQLKLPTRLLAAGFLEAEPQRDEFLAAVPGFDGKWGQTPFSGNRGQTPFSVRVPDPDAELRLAARWARARHEANPSARIGIVIHDLEARRADALAAFDEVFEPDRHHPLKWAEARSAPGSVDDSRPYGISLGLPLARSGRVGDALAALALGDTHCEWPVLSRLSLAPGIAGLTAERGERARTELRFRERVGQRVALNWALNLERLAPDWTRRIKAARALLTAAPDRRTPSDWGQVFANALDALGFPGDAPSHADEDAAGALASLLGRLGALDEVTGLIDYGQFTRLMQRECADEIHQPRTPELTVNLLGTLEAAGQAFDHLWIAGWHDGAWPPAPRPNPFLPVRLQRAKQLPHSTAAVERAYCARITDLLLNSAGEAVVSCPELDNDTPLRPSPLAPVASTDPGKWGLTPFSTWTQQLAESRQLETVPDFQAPALSTTVGKWGQTPFSESPLQASGGTGLIKDYSDCPFKAFAQRRLRAEDLDTPPTGPDARTRGSLVHDALDLVWQELKDHAGLIRRSAAQREAVLTTAIDTALKKMALEFPDLYPPAFVVLERERLLTRLTEWLDLEATRTPFTVRGRESEERIQVGPLSLRAFIDRVDELEDGSLAIIDYKTGQATKAKWAPPRPEEPQLPIYALHQADPVGAVLYARVKAGAMGFDGVTRDPALIAPEKMKGVTEPKQGFDNMLADWQAALTALGEGYAAGDARVAPKKRSHTCRHCHLTALCRIGELGKMGSDPIFEEGDDE